MYGEVARLLVTVLTEAIPEIVRIAREAKNAEEAVTRAQVVAKRKALDAIWTRARAELRKHGLAGS